MSINGALMAHLKVVGADISQALSKLTEEGIQLYDISYDDELTASFFVGRNEYKNTVYILEKCGNSVTLQNKSFTPYPVLNLLQRPMLIFGILMIVFISILLSGRILFVTVDGNSLVSSRKILEEAAVCGVRFYASAQSIRSEQVKNSLLQKIPQLQWAGVNISGCVANIRVEEKSTEENISLTESPVTSIVASCDGIIDSITVLDGNCLCQIGQAVRAGQTLISGYTDCGFRIIAQQAKGEIYATTIHNISMVFPTKYIRRTEEQTKHVSYQIKIGKKLINFNKGSGISPAVCVIMYEERYLSLPGNFQLPVSVIKKTVTSFETQSLMYTPDCKKAEDTAQKYLLSTLIAGKVLQSDLKWQENDENVFLSAQYLCREMIGRTKKELVIQGDINSD